MNLNTYQKSAITTKIYDNSVAFPYVALGICGEVGELYEKILESQKGGNFELSLLSKEVGDVAWYLAAWAEETQQLLEEVYSLRKVLTQDVFHSLEALKDNLVLEQKNVAELVKKALRDDFEELSKGIFPQEKKFKVDIAVANLLAIIMGVCAVYNLDFEQVLLENVQKLQSRKDRGTIKGSGDVR